MKYEKFDIADERLRAAKLAREAARGEVYKVAKDTIGESGVSAMRDFMELYDEWMYLWAASLWDTERGGFYYSHSGRDTEGYLPDVESTAQMMRWLSTSGMFSGRGGDYSVGTPEFMKDKLVSFARSLQYEEDGYFYHPQWGQNIVVQRRGRDLGWAVSILKNLGERPLYPTALERLEAENKKSSNEKKNTTSLLPEHLTSTEKFRAYLAEFESPESKYYGGQNSYGLGNLLQSQSSQIMAAGKPYADILFDWLAKLQREDNGLWEEGVNYDSVNGLMKLGLMYSAFERPLPNAVRALESAIAVATSAEEPGWVCCFYNPWITINNLIGNITTFGDKEKAEELRQLIIDNAADLLAVTKQKVEIFRKSDGAFSYYPKYTIGGSQNAPVAIYETPESDVNASCISSTGVLHNVCAVLGIPTVPMFCREDGDVFFELIENASPIAKINPIPEELAKRSKERHPSLY